MKLDLTALEDSVAQLGDAININQSELAKTNARLSQHLQAGAIQAFEYTYEVSVKMIKRYLEMAEASPQHISEMTFNDTIRKGYEYGLLKSEIGVWRRFRQDRGTTSHTYNLTKAKAVFDNVPAFWEEARYLLEQLKKRGEGL